MQIKSGLFLSLKLIIILLIILMLIGNGCSQPAYIVKNELLIADGQFDQAISNYQAISEQDMEDPNPHYYLARAYYLKKDYQSAEKEIDKAILLESQDDRFRLLAGRIAFAQGDYFSATNHLINCLLLNDQNLDAYYLLAETYLKTGNVDQALLQLETATALEPQFFEASLLWCRIKFDDLKEKSGTSNPLSSQNKSDSLDKNSEELELIPQEVTDASKEELTELILKLEEALQYKPGSVEGVVLLSQLYLAIGDRLMAEQSLKERLEQGETPNADLINQLAEIKYSHGEYQEALKYLAKSDQDNLASRILKLRIQYKFEPTEKLNQEAESLLKEHPDSLDLMVLLGKWKAEEGNLNEAQKILQDCIDRDPEFAFCYFQLSEVLKEQKDVFGSRWALMNAFKFEPFKRDIRLEYAARLIESGNSEGAWSILNHSSLDQTDLQVAFLKGKAAKGKKDFGQAKQLFAFVLRYGYAIEVETQLAEIDILEKNYSEAEQRIDKLKQLAESHLEVALVRALLMERTDRSELIPDLLEPYLGFSAGRGQVHLQMAEALIRLGQVEKAINILERGLKQWPRHLELVQSYTFILGISGQYDKAIYLLEDMQTFKHAYNLLFFYRLKEYYYLNGNMEKFRQQINSQDYGQ